MDQIFTMLDDLEREIFEAKKVPLVNNQFMINRDYVLSIIQAIRDHMPDAVVHANQILEREAQIKEEASDFYNNAIAEAEAKVKAMGSESKQRAEKVLADAQKKANRVYSEAQRKAEDVLVGAERKAKDLVSESAVLTEAKAEAAKVLSEARAEAQNERLGTLDQCEELLKRAEDAAIEVANELRDARLSFDEDR